MNLVQCRADSVKHAASPSRRDGSQRVIHVASDSNFSPPLPNIEMSGAATPRTSVGSVPNRVELGSTRLQASRSSAALVRCAYFSFEAHKAPGRNLDTGQPFSYCYELRTQHRLESVATRTPPPICTSAHGSQTALVSRTVERRERFNNYTMVLI